VDCSGVVLCSGRLVVLEMQRLQRDNLCHLRCVLDGDYFAPHQVRGALDLALQYVFTKTDSKFWSPVRRDLAFVLIVNEQLAGVVGIDEECRAPINRWLTTLGL